ncbi:MAG TPA: universal stress protein [Gallionellaceae bacterium]|nr:universal stress protein [Gallionellaceae bacterium]
MYQRILVPVDGSETSRTALKEAIKLAQLFNARLKLVHVVENSRVFDAEGMVDYPAMRDIATKGGEQILSRAKEMAQQAGIAAETELLEPGVDRNENVIVAEAKQWLAELVVIGTHGRSGISRLLFGSVAEGVVRGSTMPVLLIRGDH